MISSVRNAPRFTPQDAVRIAAELYNLDVSASPLPSERDQNFAVRDRSGNRFVLKVANAEERIEMLDLQNHVIELLARECPALEFPQIVRTTSGAPVTASAGPDGREHFVRLFTWLGGTGLADAGPPGRALLASLGRALGQMDAALAGFSHQAAHRSFYWDLRNAAVARQFVPLLPASRRALVDRFFTEWERIDWAPLRFSIIHNDANDHNILVNAAERRVTALLDYGDVVHTATICELAVALAYVMLGRHDPIMVASHVVGAYNEIYPLTPAEVECLYVLAAVRLCCSVCYAAYQTHEAPANDYLNVSSAAAWALLERLTTIPLDWPVQMFRFACGMPAVRQQLAARPRPRQEIQESRRKHLGASLSMSYRTPLHIVAASRQYLYDAEGRRYLDCVNNVAHVGHCHPRVVRAIADQAAVLNTNTRYLHENLAEYIERLAATLPDALTVVYLVCSGSEANELALRLARAHTGRDEVIVVDAAYHGNTNALVDLSPYKFDGPGGRGRPPWVHKVTLPDVFRGAHRGPQAGMLYASEVAEAAARSRGLAAFFCESGLSCGGQIILPQSYLAAAYAAVRAAGGVCVADEVQSGFGRAGTHFWMFETQGVIPDIVTLGKPIGNGHPLGAVVTTPEIAASFANGMEYFNTYGGNPVSCAAGLAVLDVIRDEELQDSALDVGAYLVTGLRQLQERHALIGDVRGLGLFIGIELTRDRDTRSPADREATQVVERVKDRGVLLSIDGPHRNVLKIKPPLAFSRANADLLLDRLDEALTVLASASRSG